MGDLAKKYIHKPTLTHQKSPPSNIEELMMTDDEIDQYLGTIEPVYTDRMKASLLDIQKKWNQIETEGKRLNIMMHSPPPVEIIDQETEHNEQKRKTAISDQLELIHEQAKEQRIRQLNLWFMAEIQGFREEQKKLSQIPREKIDDIQKQAEVLNILSNRCLQIQEAVKLIKMAEVSQCYSLSYGNASVLRGNWEDVIDSVSLTTEDGNVLYANERSADGSTANDIVSEDSRTLEVKSNTKVSDQGTSVIQCAVFLAMKNLTADEVSIAFVGDKTENGIEANNMLEISARGETRRVALAALDLVDRRKGILNSQCAILLGMANKKKLPSTNPNSAKVTRLRKLFSNHLGIKSDPFEPCRKGVGWTPLFMIADKRGAADERAKQKAERLTNSYEHMNEHGDQFADNNQTNELDLENPENELGIAWLEENDPDAQA